MASVYQEIIDAYKESGSINDTVELVGVSKVKVQRVLITEKVWSSKTSELIGKYYALNLSTEEIAQQLNMSIKNVQAYIPYSKGEYTNDTRDSIRSKRYRERKVAIAEIKDDASLWNCLVLFQGYPFKTLTGLKFKYEIRNGKNGNYTRELWIDRREESKSLTMSTVEKAFQKAVEMKGTRVLRPKALGDLRGISYVYSIFYRFGLIDVPEDFKKRMN